MVTNPARYAGAITHKQLVELEACKDQAELFKSLFGESVVLTEDLCIKHWESFDKNWFIHTFFNKGQYAAYYKARAPLHKAYWEALAPITKDYREALGPLHKAYWEARAPIDKAFDEARAQLNKAYYEARTPIDKAYWEARAPIDKAYREARARAFFNIYSKE